jgi:hypothetical protein
MLRSHAVSQLHEYTFFDIFTGSSCIGTTDGNSLDLPITNILLRGARYDRIGCLEDCATESQMGIA